jgi:biotin carboxyl carrier protein
MTYRVEVNGRAREIRLELRDGSYHWRLDQQEERAASVLPVEPGVYSVLADGRSWQVHIVAHQDGYAVAVNGHPMMVRVQDPRSLQRDGRGAAADGAERLIAPMPGRVIRLLAAAGDELQPGQGIVVVEAMKMQNEIKTARAGRLVQLLVAEGATVGAGEVLGVIE